MAAPAIPNATASTAKDGGAGLVDYAQNERVLCFHGPLIYEAKILQMKDVPGDEAMMSTGKAGIHYFVHYKGWKQTWDEWVPHSRLLKMTDANVEKQKQLQKEYATTQAAGTSLSGASKTHKTGASAAGVAGSARTAVRKDARGTKRARDEDDSAKKPEMKLAMPEQLKRQLVDDWENVTKSGKVVSLPRSPTVVEILEQFSKHVIDTKPPHLREPEVLLPTITSGLQAYFDKSLGTNLLYRFERVQYSDVRKQYATGQHVRIGVDDKEMSHIYGAEHLLRMIVALPGMVAASSLEPDSAALVRDYVNELLQFMLKEKPRLFQAEYENPTSGYSNVARP